MAGCGNRYADLHSRYDTQIDGNALRKKSWRIAILDTSPLFYSSCSICYTSSMAFIVGWFVLLRQASSSLYLHMSEVVGSNAVVLYIFIRISQDCSTQNYFGVFPELEFDLIF